MTPNRLLGLLLVTAVSLTVFPSLVQGASPEDPCALARRIAESPPCREKSDCEAVNLWQRAFPPPGSQHAGADPADLPEDLASRLPDASIRLPEGVRPLRQIAEELAAAAGLGLLVDPGLALDETIRTPGGSLPLEEAWRRFLRSTGLTARLLPGKGSPDGDRILLREAPAPGQPRGWGPSFDCPAR